VGLPFVDAILKEFGVNVEVINARKKPQSPDMKDTGYRIQDTGSKIQDTASGIQYPASVSGASLHPASCILNQERSDSAYSIQDRERSEPIVPSSGRYIVASNHPLGGLDGMALMQVLGKVRQDIVFPVNDLLMNVPGLRPLFIPINKHGRNTENARLIDETFASEKMILYFPAGLVSRKISRKKLKASTSPPNPSPQGEGRIQHPASSILHPASCILYPISSFLHPTSVIRDLEWKSTFIKKAKKYHRDIIPVYISGRNSDWFYNLSNWRKRLGIKANIEMLYLVDEMTLQLGKTITLMIGDIIPYSTFDKSRTESQWAEWVKEKVYTLEQKINN
jgi:putative hemolysin